MTIVKSSLNKLIIKMVTRERVLRTTGCPVEDFNNNVANWAACIEYRMKGLDGVDIFIEYFRKEGWCKTELRSILDTLFHLNREIREYGIYWF